LIEKRDTNGKLALVNNIPIKTKISQKETYGLISRLGTSKIEKNSKISTKISK